MTVCTDWNSSVMDYASDNDENGETTSGNIIIVDLADLTEEMLTINSKKTGQRHHAYIMKVIGH